jgi:hypothetical protein
MTTGAAIYRATLAMYPADFRRDYGDAMEQAFSDLVADRGSAAAWRRTSIDLLVTVPRFRMETVMNPDRTTTAVAFLAGLVALPALALVVLGFYPALILLGAALIVSFAQRTRLARSLRAGDGRSRSRSLVIAAALALVAIATLTVGMADVSGEDPWPVARVLAYNAVFFVSIIAAIAFLVSGLFTRPNHPNAQPAASTH